MGLSSQIRRVFTKMAGLRAILTGVFAFSSLAGCRGKANPELDTYLAVVDSVSEEVKRSVSLNSPQGANVCFASTFWPGGKKALPGQLLDALTEQGWALYDPGDPPDTETFLVFVSEPRFEGEEQFIAAGYQVWEVFRDEVIVWGDHWEYGVECHRDSCRVTGVFGGTHSDFASSTIEEFTAKERGDCNGSVPSLR